MNMHSTMNSLTWLSRVALFNATVASFAVVLPAIRVAHGKSESPKPPQKIGWEEAKMDPAMAGRIEKAVTREIEKGNMSGCVVLIGRREGIVFEQAYGNRAVKPDVEP